MSAWEHDLAETLLVLSHDMPELRSRLSRTLRESPELKVESRRVAAGDWGISHQCMSSYMEGKIFPVDLISMARLSAIVRVDMLEMLYYRAPSPRADDGDPDLTRRLLRAPKGDLYEAYASSLSRALFERDISMEELRSECHMSCGVVNRIIAGSRHPSARTALMISAALGVSPIDMLLGSPLPVVSC